MSIYLLDIQSSEYFISINILHAGHCGRRNVLIFILQICSICSFVENPLSGHAIFLQRQFWGAFKLYRNVLAWHGILSDSLVAEMALNSILNR